jgi:hypothetical protein
MAGAQAVVRLSVWPAPGSLRVGSCSADIPAEVAGVLSHLSLDDLDDGVLDNSFRHFDC